MTSTVIIKAHCSPDKRVRIFISEKEGEGYSSAIFIKDGEEKELYVYDDRSIKIQEVIYDIEN